MKRTAKLLSILLFVLVVASAPAAGKKNSEKAHVVDSGSFGVLVNGRRVATETFVIEQGSDGSVAKSELRVDEGAKAGQRAEMRLAANGDLRRYEWKETAPGKSQSVVEPADQFLIQKVFATPSSKPIERPFLMPVSTVVLEDYFFSHRELLLWRYLAQACGSKPDCQPGKSQFAVIIPRQQNSAPVTLEYVGREPLTLHGQQRVLDHFRISMEESVWSVWMDSEYKVQRILIPDSNTEVLRD